MAARAHRALWGWGGATALILTLVALAPALSRHDPNRMNIALALKPPSAAHWFGTDEAGRDILSRVLHGGRESITAALAVILAALLIGMVIGALAALWYGGVLRQLSATWIVIGIVIAAGLGIMLAISAGKPEITRD